MQPLKTTTRPRSLSTIGWAACSERSITLSRRCPRAAGPWAHIPALSGPRDACRPVILATASTSAARLSNRSSPLSPHICLVSFLGVAGATFQSDWRVPTTHNRPSLRRSAVRWHNGRAFVADDVVFSYQRIMDRRVGAPNAYRFETVESVTAPDDHTVLIKVKRPTPNLLSLIGAFKGMAIVPREIVENGTIARRPVGTGPFRFVEYVPNDRVVLERNPDYWQPGKPHVDRVVFKPIPDETVKVTNLRAGEVDWADSVPPQQIHELGRDDQIVVESAPSNDYWYLATNLRREPYRRREARRAISTAIDREEVTRA